MNRKGFQLLTILIVSCLFMSAQKKWSVFLGPGAMYYNGDLRQSSLPDPRVLHFSINAGLGYELNSKFSVHYRYLKGKVSGNDAFALTESKKNRGFQFESPITEHSLRLHYDFLRFGKEKFASLSLIGGIGTFKFNPIIELNGSKIAAQPLGTEGQNLGGSYLAPYKLRQISIPIGGAFLLPINNKWGVKLEATYHKTFTDYLDDVSGTYANYNDLEASQNGATTIAASYKGTGDNYPSGSNRGNPNLMDSYLNLAISAVYKFGRNSKPTKDNSQNGYSCPAFR